MHLAIVGPLTCLPFLLALSAATAPAQAQRTNSRIDAAIQRLGDPSAKVRARARSTILSAGPAALEQLRRTIAAHPSEPAERLFVIAEALGQQRRALEVTLDQQLDLSSWRLEWLRDGTRLAILHGIGGKLQFYDPQLKPIGDATSNKLAYFAIAPDDRSLAHNAKAGGAAIATIPALAGRQAPAEAPIHIPAANKPSVTFAPDGQTLITTSYGNVAEQWRVADGKRLQAFEVAGQEGGLSATFSPDGKLLVIGNRNDKTHIFDSESGKVLHVLDREMTHQMAFSPDGQKLAATYVDGKIGIWNPQTGALEKLLDGNAAEVFSVAWSPDGKLLASAGHKGPVTIWSGTHLAKLHSLKTASDRVFRVAFRPDGKQLIAAGNNATYSWKVEMR